MSKQGTNTAYLAKVVDGIAIVTLDHFPMNALSVQVRNGLTVAIRDLEKRDDIKGVVVHGAGKCFCAGADISEFGGATAKMEQLDRKVTDFCGFEGMKVPVVAAIHNVALGGGLELALGCHYRIIDSNAAVGLPEINLGLLPGGQGTQRMPRLCGPENALKMMLSGKHIKAQQAMQMGIVDAVVPAGEALVLAAVAFCKAKAGQTRRVCEMAPPPAIAWQPFRDQMKKKRRGEPAALAIIRTVEAACKGPTFEDGDKVEKEEFSTLMKSPESRCLRYMFFGERAGAKVANLKAKAKTIKSVGIVGAGLMGGGIAMCCANIGIQVVLLDVAQAGLDRGLKLIDANYARSVKSGSRSKQTVDKARALITGSIDYSALAQCDLVVEAVFEDMDIKKKIFRKLDQVCKPDAFLCTNTSYLSIDEIASVTKRPELVMGTHFFSPANVMKLLENVRGSRTSDRTIATMMKWGKSIGKWVILVGNCNGFVGNRMVNFYSGGARAMLEEGATPSQIDGVALKFGMRMGPLAMGDLVGLDLGMQAIKKAGQWDPQTQITHALVESGRCGLKTAGGYFDYPGRKLTASTAAQAIIAQVAKNKGIGQRQLQQEEIVERLFYPLINEGFKILEEGMAQKPSDVDTCYVHGYSWPRYRGGPMIFADMTGLPKILKALESMPGVEVSQLLKTCVREKTTLADYWKKNGAVILAASVPTASKL